MKYLHYQDCTPKYRDLLEKMDEYLSQLDAKSLAFTYGSVPFNEHTDQSDIDVLVFFESLDDNTISDFVNFWREKCVEAGIDDDGEVPRRKLLGGTFDNLYAAIELEPFRKKSSEFIVPDILDTAEYYESDALLQRLSFNAITMKNFFVHGDEDIFRELKCVAQNNLIFLLFEMSHGHIHDTGSYVESMIYEWQGSRKEGLYLGYKDWRELRSYFTDIFAEVIKDNAPNSPHYRFVPQHLKS